MTADTASDTAILELEQSLGGGRIPDAVTEALQRAVATLARTSDAMAWEVVPLDLFARLPEGIRSAWVFAIRGGARTEPERHPNSHQRSLSLIESGSFELRPAGSWIPHPLVSGHAAPLGERWVTIPPSTWHRLVVGPRDWGMLSFHTCQAEELIEESPVDPARLEGPVRRQRYADRQGEHS